MVSDLGHSVGRGGGIATIQWGFELLIRIVACCPIWLAIHNTRFGPRVGLATLISRDGRLIKAWLYAA